MAHYIAYVLLAMFVMALAWWTSQNPNYFYNEVQAVQTSAMGNLPNPSDSNQVKAYVEQKFMEGAMKEDDLNAFNKTQTSLSVDELNEPGAIEKYVTLKFNEGLEKNRH